MRLSWSLLVPTYNRRKALRTSLELAAKQGRPPAEIVIVDASIDWAESRAQMLDEVAPLNRDVRWRYHASRVRSSATQRNQAIDLASSDIFFMLDDDSYMYPHCAERVMQIYEADCHCGVAGVGPMEAPVPYEGQRDSDRRDCAPPPSSILSEASARVMHLFDRQLDVEKLLLPYDCEYPDHAVPSELFGLNVSPTRYLSGMRMTFRAPLARKERFDDTLLRYAAAEDMDVSYRISRHGVLINALDAQLFHARDPNARLTRHTRALLGLLNLAYLYRRHGADLRRMFRTYRGRLLTRLGIDVVRDLAKNRTNLPYARADFRALRTIDRMLEIDDAELVQWYTSLQGQLLNQNLE